MSLAVADQAAAESLAAAAVQQPLGGVPSPPAPTFTRPWIAPAFPATSCPGGVICGRVPPIVDRDKHSTTTTSTKWETVKEKHVSISMTPAKGDTETDRIFSRPYPSP